MTYALVMAGVALLAHGTPARAQEATPIRLTVEEALARGFAASHRLAEVTARGRGAQAVADAANAADRPTVTATAGYSRTNHVPEFFFTQPTGSRVVVFPDIPDNAVSRVGFQWPIYTSGRVDALERAAAVEAGASAADLETARADLRLEIVRAYWAAVTAREAERVVRESLTRADAQLRDARERFAVGLIPPNDVSTLEAQRSREEAQHIEAQNLRESTLVDLRRLVGAEPDAPIELVDGLEAGLEGVPAPGGQRPDLAQVTATVRDALTRRPERKALTLRLGGAEARADAARLSNRPVVGLGGGYDYANPNPHIFPRKGIWQDSWDVSINISWSLADFGRTRAQALEATAAADALRERLNEFDVVAAGDIRQRMLDLDSSLAVVRAATDAVRSAAEARRVVAQRFGAGVATSTDVLVAQDVLLQSELQRTRALANVKLAQARLDRALGRP
jgi:outer membrane protein TolC